MVEADVDVLESRACCVQLAVLLTTHCGSHQWLSLIAVKGIPLTLPPLDSGSEWLPPMASLIAVEDTSLTLPPLDPGMVLILK